MALVLITIQDKGPGKVDMRVDIEPPVQPGAIELPDDTPAVTIMRSALRAAVAAAQAYKPTNPQED